MRSRLPVAIVFATLMAACAAPAAETTTLPEATTTTTTAPPTTTTTTAPTTTTTLLRECPRAPYLVPELPVRASGPQVPAENIAFDMFTSVAGTHSTIWLDGDGGLVVALIRGTLPPEDWPGPKGEVLIDGAKAVAGQFADGSWVVGWFEQPGQRCDLYTMVFYPPVTPAEVQATLAAMDRTAG